MRTSVAVAAAGLLAVTSAGTTVTAVTAGAANASPPQARSTPHQQAVAEAKALMALAPKLEAATRVATSPTKRLSQPPQTTSPNSLVVRARYWRINESFTSVYNQLTAATPDGLIVSGSGTSSGPGKNDTIKSAFYTRKTTPPGIDYSELDISVTPIGSHGHTAIGIYAQAVPVPTRPAKERVPTTVKHVHVALQTIHGHVKRGSKVTGEAATTLAAAFDALERVPPGTVTSCPADRGARRIVAFRFRGHVVDVTSGFCDMVGVVRDGQRLPGLYDSPAFEKDIKSDLAPKPAPARRTRPKKPASETVPTSVHKARLQVRNRPPYTTVSRHATVTGKRAAALVSSFNALKPERKDAPHCDVIGGPENVIIFRTPKHTWRVREASCTNVEVARDGSGLPTLLASNRWDKAVKRGLAH